MNLKTQIVRHAFVYGECLLAFLLGGCASRVLSVQDGQFDVRSQPLFLNAVPKNESSLKVDMAVGGFLGTEEEFRSSGLKNEELKQGALILPESDAQVRYNMLNINGDLSVSFTVYDSLIGGESGYYGLQLGALPYFYAEFHGGLKYKYGFVGLSASLGVASDRAVYTGQFANRSICIVDCYDEDLWTVSGERFEKDDLIHANYTFGEEISVDLGAMVINYYVGIYQPWLKTSLPGRADDSKDYLEDYDISFRFPFLFVQDIAVAYQFENARLLSGVRIVASKDLGYSQVGMFGQVAYCW